MRVEGVRVQAYDTHDADTLAILFNLKENFLREQDTSGFSRLIRRRNREGYIQTLCYRRYQHRISIAGEPLHYVAVIARKLKDFNNDLLESLESDAGQTPDDGTHPDHGAHSGDRASSGDGA